MRDSYTSVNVFGENSKIRLEEVIFQIRKMNCFLNLRHNKGSTLTSGSLVICALHMHLHIEKSGNFVPK